MGQVLPADGGEADALVFYQEDEGVYFLQPGPGFVVFRENPGVLCGMEGVGFGGEAVEVFYYLWDGAKALL